MKSCITATTHLLKFFILVREKANCVIYSAHAFILYTVTLKDAYFTVPVNLDHRGRELLTSSPPSLLDLHQLDEGSVDLTQVMGSQDD